MNEAAWAVLQECSVNVNMLVAWMKVLDKKLCKSSCLMQGCFRKT